MAISKVASGFGRFQKGEDVIVCTYDNADKAVKSLLKRPQLTYKVSLSRLFKEHLAEIKEMDDILTWKKVAQSIKETEKDLEKMEKSGFTIETTRIKYKVQDTRYTVIFKIQNRLPKKIIARKIIRQQ